MRRWFEMYTDPSQTFWAYSPGQIGDNVQRIWIGMPPKLQAVEWINHATQIYIKWAVASPGANPNYVCGSGETFPNPDYNFQVVANYVRADSILFLPIPNSFNIKLFEQSATRPHSDSIDPNQPPW
jgi:hypothetical protein